MREVILGVEGGMVALDVRVDGELGLFVFFGGWGKKGSSGKNPWGCEGGFV